jgi:SET domain-containing protein
MRLASYRSPKTAVKNSGIVGRGLFAAEPIPRGEVVCVKGGHLIDRATLERHSSVVNDAELQVADDLYLAPLASDEFEGVMMFLNHSCEPNVGVQGQIVFVAMRDIEVSEELTLDYATIDHGAEPMACRCGAAACRGVVSVEDWRNPDLQRKYDGYFAWHLQQRISAGR